MNKVFIIVGAGSMEGSELRIPDRAAVIAADGGYGYLLDAGVKPDIVLGDFDSLGYVPKAENVLTVPSEKDDTDTMLAVKEALARGAETVVLYGCLGGRFDHSIANLQALKYIAARGARGYLVGGGNICTVIKDGGIAFEADENGFISVFSMGEQARGVDLRGLKYPLSDATVTDDFPIGVSNEFTAVPSSVSVGSGFLLVIWSGCSFDPDKYKIIP